LKFHGVRYGSLCTVGCVQDSKEIPVYTSIILHAIFKTTIMKLFGDATVRVHVHVKCINVYINNMFGISRRMSVMIMEHACHSRNQPAMAFGSVNQKSKCVV
jgi:hypothetical protein